MTGPGRQLFRRIAAFAGACLCLAALAASAQAATFTVGSTSDTTPGAACATFPTGCSLRQLIEHEDTAGTNDTILVPSGSYSLTNGQLNLTQNMTIAGAGARTTSIAQQTTTPTSRVFAILGNPNSGFTPTVTISRLDMYFGKADSTSTPQYFGGNIVNEGTLTLSEDFVEDGTTTSGSGAGISNYGGTLTVTHSLVASNGTAQTNDSGGIQNVGPNPITNSPAQLTVIESTIAENTAAQGGGIMSWNDSGNTATIINSTITGNDGGARSTVGGGLLAADGGTISVENSIVAGNTVDNPSAGTPSNCGTSGSTPGTITSLGYNLESATDCGFTSTGDHQNTDPGFLSGISDFGGNTNTFALRATSPAVDAIPAGSPNCAGSDQRDVPRPQGSGCDIGSFELFQPVEGQSFTTVVGAVSGSSVSINWGDGTSTPAAPDPTTGQVTGTHTYAEEGVYHAVINYRNSDNTPEQFPFDVKVQDAPLSSTPISVVATAGSPFTGPVATFTDADPAGTASDYSATIVWGDGSITPGSVSAASGGFAVTGTHTYAKTGSYSTTVSITDAGGASTVAHGTATAGSVPTPVITGAPSVTSPGGAGFSGSANPNGLPTMASFQYGLDPKYSAGGGPVVYTNSTPAQNVGSDFASHIVTASVSSLVPNALYHVRLVATNSAGTSFGPDVTFTTGKLPPPGSPTLGKTFNISLVSGVVLSEVNGKFIPLTELTQIPKNTVINALHGTLSLTTAALGPPGARDAAAKGKKHKKPPTQKGSFGGAIFKISQATRGAGKGLVTLTIVESAFKGAPSYSLCTKHHSRRRHRGKGLVEDAPVAARQRPREVHHQGTLQRSDRARHDMDDRRPLRRDAHSRHHRLGQGQRLRPPQDGHPPRRPELSGDRARTSQVELRNSRCAAAASDVGSHDRAEICENSTVLRLFGIVVSIGLADSMNPSTIAPGLYLALGERARSSLIQFTLAVVAVNFVGGAVIALGPGQVILHLVPHPHATARYILETIAGVVMLIAAVVLWVKRKSLRRRELPSASAEGKSAILLGVTISAVELPTAFPYFAAIAAIVGSDIGPVRQLVALALYNVAFVLPLILMILCLSSPAREGQAHHRSGA